MRNKLQKVGWETSKWRWIEKQARESGKERQDKGKSELGIKYEGNSSLVNTSIENGNVEAKQEVKL